MLHGVKTKQAYDQIISEGYIFLYRGILPPLAQKTVSLSVMFGVYDAARRPLIETLHFNPYLAVVTAGLIAGSVEAALMPFERIQTLLADSTYHQYFKNTPEACKYCILFLFLVIFLLSLSIEKFFWLSPLKELRV